MPIIFRMIYSCGLRVSEVRLLKVKDVDFNSGILTINHSKKNNSRLVSMTIKLTEKCRIYSNVERYYFPIKDNKPMSIGSI